MKYKKINSFFQKKIEDQSQDQKVIISFEDLSKREKFLSKNKELKIIKKFDLIPSIYVNLKKEQIVTYDKENIIKLIEENQKLYLSMLDVIEILELDNYRTSQISYTGKDITIGIIDDGINTTFPSISKIVKSQQILNKRKKSVKLKNNNKEVTHGTIMASIIGNQFKDFDDNFIGIAPNVNISDFDISNLKKEFYFSNILEIFDRIVNQSLKIDILLISLTTLQPSDGKDILSLACDMFVDRGIIIVCPAGNLGPKPYSIGSPSAAEKVITIGSLDKEFSISEFSGRGPTLDERMKPDFCLPGSKIKVPLSNDLRVNVSGTSVSASIGVGLIALIKEHNPNMLYNDILILLKKSSINLNYERAAQGYGIITVPNIFKNLDLFHDKILPYSYLIKKSLKISIEFGIILTILFYFFYFFKIT